MVGAGLRATRSPGVGAQQISLCISRRGSAIPVSTWAAVEPIESSAYASNYRDPYAENFQLSVEREFPSQVVMRLSYVGALGRRNQIDPPGNYETAAGHAACLAGAEHSPYTGSTLSCSGNSNYQNLLFPQNTIAGSIDPNTGGTGFTDVGLVTSDGSSNYNSFQASVNKAVTHGLLFQVSYTYAHAMDDSSSFENSGFGGQRGYNIYVPSLNYGDSGYDARQRLVLSPLYVIPKFAGSNYSFMNLAVAGWEVSGITQLATGFPFDISYGGATSNSLWCSAYFNYYACPDIPNQVAPATFGNLRVRAASGNSVYITNAGTAFTPEAIGTFGNIHRNPYHGPGVNQTNMILAKNFYVLPERGISIQIRMESDNVFNHTQFSLPTSNITSGNFGVITGAQPARETQLAAKISF